MNIIEIGERVKRDEFEGEKLISKFRVLLGAIYVISVPLISFVRNLEGFDLLPPRAFIFNNVFFLYSVFLFFYLRKKDSVHPWFKYICVVLDMLIISASIWLGCTYVEIAAPFQFLSIWALFYSLLILAGSFRYSVPCAIFSGIFAGFCYLIVVIINSGALNLELFFILHNKRIPVSFPIYYEFFRVAGIIITGLITGIACKRHLSLFSNMIYSQAAAARTASNTVEQTREMAKIIHKSTEEIFHSSKEIFSTANNQAASVQQIETTIKENTQIAGDIAEKTSNVAGIASKMENDVIHGFSVLERNVDQLENIKNKNDGVITGIVSLGNKIAKIRDIIKTINTITDQTKVIAFNAALEAASAGEHGKRFSVVASEVNRLADDITNLTKQIHEQVEEIQNSSSSLIVSGEESANKINEGNNLIKELEDIFRDVKTGAQTTAAQAQTITVSTQKQLKSTEQINKAISDISEGLVSFIQSTRIATSSAEDLTEFMKKLDELLSDKNIEEIGD
jgi:methyl-accepting chemotaxis protein